MKRIFTLLILGTASLGFAQSFALYKTNGAGAITSTITNGSIINEASTPSVQVNTKIRIKNNAANTQTFSVLRTVISHTPTLDLSASASNPTTYFCFGYTCFSSNVNSAGPPDYTVLTASGQTSTAFPNADNSDANGQPFSIYLDEGSTAGIYTVKYKVFRTDNQNDTISFIVSYNGPAAIKDHRASSLSFEVYPNPATTQSNLFVNSQKSETVIVSLTNIAGQMVYNKKHNLIPGGNYINLNCEEIEVGVYSVSLQNEKGSFTKKLIITR